ncbi:hypothetical protein TNCV_4728061 [Trichonephila clavipes]|nr:hypothetical protein TNCV_4728061 [Trichonephila clavipes]
MALSTMLGYCAISLVSTPILREITLGPKVYHFPFCSSNLGAQRIFRVPLCREGTIHLQTPMPPPGIEPMTYGTVVSVANQNTGWIAPIKLTYSLTYL